MISLKARNSVVISPHPRAIKACVETARIMEDAAVLAGAPKGLIQCLDVASMAAATELMTCEYTSVILATGGSALVKAAYSSGKPAYGVGPGNVPAFIERSADVSQALDRILMSKTFDYGTICASEQAIVTERVIANQVRAQLQQKGGYFVTGADKEKLEKTVIKETGGVNPDVVGKSPQVIADLAGITIPAGASSSPTWTAWAKSIRCRLRSSVPSSVFTRWTTGRPPVTCASGSCSSAGLATVWSSTRTMSRSSWNSP